VKRLVAALWANARSAWGFVLRRIRLATAGTVASFRAEMRDVWRHALVWIGLAAVIVSAWLVGRHEPIRDNGWVVYEAALQAAARTAAFFLLAMASVAVAGDRTRGTIRWILPRPISRVGYVLGKALAHSAIAVAFLVAAAGTSWMVAQPLGFGDVRAEIEGDEDDAVFNYIEDEEVEHDFQAATMRERTAFATLLLLPALLTATGLGLLVSSVIGSAAGAVILGLAVALPLAYLPEVLGLSSETSHALPFRAATDALYQVREFGRHLATARWPEYTQEAAIGAAVAILALPALAAAIFTRLDITD
jgi:hypothetical protein